MIKVKKSSVLALLLAMAMVFTVCMPVMAEEATTPAGTLFVPYKGQMSAIDLGAAFSITDNTAGVFKSGNTLLLDGDITKAGSVTVNGTAMQVSPYVLYEDFEDGTVGNEVFTTKIEKLSASAEDKSMFASTSTALVAGDSSNKYGAGNSNASTVIIPLDSLSENGYNGKVTITAKIRRNNGDAAALYPGIAVLSGTSNLVYFCFDKATTTSALSTRGNSDGTSNGTSNREFVGALKTDAWIDMRLELDLKNGEYSTYVGDTIKIENYKMIGTPANVSLSNCTLQFGVNVDDISIYSGVPFENTNTITGTKAILAPAAGKYSKIDGYKVATADSGVVNNPNISLVGSYEGMIVRDNALLISNDVTAGKKVLLATDTNGDFLAKDSVEVLPYVYYEDFEDAEENAGITSTKIGAVSNSVSAKTMFVTVTNSEEPVVAVLEGNKYAAGNGVSGDLKVINASLGADMPENVNSGKVTVSAKVYRTSEDGSDAEPGIYVYDSNGKALLDIRFITKAGNTTTAIWSKYQANGTSKLGNGSQIGSMNHNRWVDVALELDFNAKTYSLYIDGTATSAKGYTMANSAVASGVIGSVQFGTATDEIAICSGTPVSITADAARFAIPAAGENTYTINAKYNNGTAVSNLSCSTDANSVSISGNTVSVSSDADVVPVTVTLSETDKNYVLLNGAEYDGSATLVAGSNTVYAVYGASDMKAGNIIHIARYSKNGELIALENFAKSATTAQVIDATLTDSFNTGDIAKVFIWKNGTLVPLGNAVEIR